MIRNRVSALMGERRENISDLKTALGVSYTTAHRLYHGTTDRIEFRTLDAICRHFGVTPEQVLEYVPEVQGTTAAAGIAPVAATV